MSQEIVQAQDDLAAVASRVEAVLQQYSTPVALAALLGYYRQVDALILARFRGSDEYTAVAAQLQSIHASEAAELLAKLHCRWRQDGVRERI
jgi:monoamine oxidase